MFVSVVLLFAGCTSFQAQVEEMLFPEQPVCKKIILKIYAGKNYSAAVYQDALAALEITVIKTSGNTRTVVWNKTYETKQLAQYPALENALPENIIISNIKNSREKVEVIYALTYNTKGSMLQMYGDMLVAAKEQTGQLYISL